MRPAIRLAALSHLQSLFVFTHDSVFLGEDGPTHQPVEHSGRCASSRTSTSCARATRSRCAAAWAHALSAQDGPDGVRAHAAEARRTCRAPDGFDPKVMLRGAYVIAGRAARARRHGARHARHHRDRLRGRARRRREEGPRRRRASACASCRRPAGTRSSARTRPTATRCCPPGVRRVVDRNRASPIRGAAWSGHDGLVIGRDDFGVSAPDKDIQKEFGFTVEAVTEKIQKWLG